MNDLEQARTSGGSYGRVRQYRLVELSIIPAAIFIATAYEISCIAPFYSHQTFGSDPSYVYLFNGMGIVQGFAPFHVDHPGTPLQILIGLVAGFFWGAQSALGFTNDTFEETVFRNPELYLKVISYILLSLNVAAIYFLGRQIVRCSGSLMVAAFTQAGFLLFGNLLPYVAYVSPEALLVTAAAMLLAYLCPAIFNQDEPPQSAKLAFFAALGCTTKVTFIPLLAMLAIIPGLATKARVAVLFVVFSLLLVFPALSEMERTLGFVEQIMTHKGLYGSGDPGLIDFPSISNRIEALWAAVPMLFLALGVAAIVTALSMITGNLAMCARGGTFAFVILLQIVITLKHFQIRYVIPSLAISPLVLAWFLWSLKARFSTLIVYAASAAMLIIATVTTRACVTGFAGGYDAREKEIAAIPTIMSQHSGALVIDSYYVRDVNFAKQFGLLWANPAYTTKFAKREGLVSYDRAKNDLVIGSEKTPVATLPYIRNVIASGREVILYFPSGLIVPDIRYSLLYQISPNEALYLVEAASAETH